MLRTFGRSNIHVVVVPLRVMIHIATQQEHEGSNYTVIGKSMLPWAGLISREPNLCLFDYTEYVINVLCIVFTGILKTRRLF